MGLKKLADLLDDEHEKFIENVARIASNIRLKYLVSGAEFKSPSEFESFHYGEYIKVCEKDTELFLNVGKNKLIVKYKGMKLRTFSGTHVTMYYNKLAEQIIKAREEYEKSTN